MRQRVLKALANPPRIFYMPYTLALINFLCWFLIFVVFMVISLIVTSGNDIPMWLPLAFLGVLSLTHIILGFYSRKDSQISQIIFSTLKIFKNKIPRRLIV